MEANLQWNHLNDFYLSDWPQTDTHTQKEMDLVGLYSALQLGMEGELRVRVWPGTWPPREVLPTRGVELGIRGRERGSPARALQHNPPRWDSNPQPRIQRAHDPGFHERRSTTRAPRNTSATTTTTNTTTDHQGTPKKTAAETARHPSYPSPGRVEGSALR